MNIWNISKAHVQISVFDMYIASVLNNQLRMAGHLYSKKRSDLWKKQDSLKTKTWQLCIHRTNYHCLMPSSRSPMYYLITLIDLHNIIEKLLCLKYGHSHLTNAKTKMYDQCHKYYQKWPDSPEHQTGTPRE